MPRKKTSESAGRGACPGGGAGAPVLEQLEHRLLLAAVPFVEWAEAGLAGVERSSAAWGDCDNDGRLDILLTGWTGTQTVSKVYRNSGGSFTKIGADLAAVYLGWASWADYDADGDLDFVLSGNTHAPDWQVIARIYRNDQGGFADVGASLPGVYRSFASWADYDNDGDLDLLLAGWTGTEHITKLYRNEAGSFVQAGADLVGVSSASASWGDYDRDGDLDLLLAGWTGAQHVTKVYRNDGGSFADIGASLPGISSGSACWTDFNGDGDLDILLAGASSSGPVAEVYANEAGGFTAVGAGLVGVEFPSAWCADYDNDGDADILLTGSTASGPVSRIYRNDGEGFTDVQAGLPGVYRGTGSWADFDNDGDLDILLTGWTGTQRIAKLFRNTGDIFNSPPTAPRNLWAMVSDSRLVFHWDGADDDQTSSEGLTYNLRVGTGSGDDDVCPAMADLTTGRRLLPAPGNAQSGLSWSLDGLAMDVAYHWSVQAIDGALAGSAWATEQLIIIASDAPQAPAGLSAEPASASQIHLSWQDNSDNEDGFKIERRGGGSDAWTRVATVPANATAYQDEGLRDNTSYSYRLRAYNTAGHSPYCETAAATTFEIAPAAPSNLAAAGASASRIRLSWQDGSENEAGFQIERLDETSGLWAQIATVGPDVTRYDDVSLQAVTHAAYRVRAYNTAGESPYSDQADGATLAITVLLESVEISDGQAEAVDFGSVLYGGPGASKTFTVRNDFSQPVTFGGVGLPPGYSLAEGLAQTLAPGEADTFTVRLETATAGLKPGQVSFSTTGGGENIFDFAVTGTVKSLPAEVSALLDGAEIHSGQVAPVNFGNADCGGSGVARVFTVRNVGQQTLTLGTISLPEGFSLLEPLASSLGGGQSDTFTLRLDSDVPGTKSGQVSFSTNDSDEDPFFFVVSGTVTLSGGPPEVTVLLDGGQVFHGQAMAIDFGSVQQGAPGPTRTFTVRNDGGQTLSLGTPALPTGFSLSEGLLSSLEPGESDTFTIRLESYTAGTKSGSVSFASNDGDENPFSFEVLGSVTATVTDPDVAEIGQGAAATVSYTDADGSFVTVALRGGTATVRFLGQGLQQQPGKRGVIVTGADVRIAEIVLSGTTVRSSLSIKVKGGDGKVLVGRITGSSPVGRLIGRNIDLIGEGIQMTGAGFIGSIALGDLTGGAGILMPGTGAARGMRIIAGRLADDAQIALGSGLANLAAAEWAGGSLTTPWVGSMRVSGDRRRVLPGDFGAEVALTGPAAPNGLALKSAKVAGKITGGDWLVNGNGEAIQFACSAPGWTATFHGDVRSLKVTGNRRLALPGDLCGQWTSNALKSVSVAGDFVNAQMALDQPPDGNLPALGVLSVKGWLGSPLEDGDVRTCVLSAGDIGKITAGAVGNAAIFAGAIALGDPQGGEDGVLDLPDPATAISLGAGRARISSLQIKGLPAPGGQGQEFSYSLINSNIAAAELGRVVLGPAQTDGGQVFGLAADRIDQLTVQDGGGRESLKDLDLPSQSLYFGCMEIRLA